MHAQPVGNPPFTEVDYVCVSTNLMTKMMSELQSLQVYNQWLTLALATAGHDLRGRLQTLMGTIELLSVSRDGLRTADSEHRTTSSVTIRSQVRHDRRHSQRREAVRPTCMYSASAIPPRYTGCTQCVRKPSSCTGTTDARTHGISRRGSSRDTSITSFTALSRTGYASGLSGG